MIDKTLISNLNRAFKVLDKDNDGKLSMEEITEGYLEYFEKEQLSENDIELIIKRVDADKNNYIDFSEWVVATVNKETLLSDEKLEFAFSLFD